MNHDLKIHENSSTIEDFKRSLSRFLAAEERLICVRFHQRPWPPEIALVDFTRANQFDPHYARLHYQPSRRARGPRVEGKQRNGESEERDELLDETGSEIRS